jgi:hypothetical protein
VLDFVPSPWIWTVIEDRDKPLQRLNLNTWFWIGANLARGEQIKLGISARDGVRHLTRVDAACELILDQQVPRLDFSAGSCRALLKSTTEALQAVDAQLDAGKFIETIEDAIIQPVINAYLRFKNLLQEDLARKNVYSVRESEVYSVASLIDNGDAIIPEKLRFDLPQPCLDELKQAGRCLAFELATASAFHIMRAIEVMLLEYWDIVTGDPRPDNRNWGGLLKEIDKKGGDKDVIDAVTHVKNLHRNPIVHPELTLTMDEALVLWGSAPAVIVTLNRDILKRKPPPATAAPTPPSSVILTP